MAVVFLCQITFFLQQNTTASLLELYFSDSMHTVYMRSSGGGGGGNQRREVADGADVVFTDTGCGRVGSAECITKGSRCLGVVMIKIETNVSGSSQEGRDSLSPQLVEYIRYSL